MASEDVRDSEDGDDGDDEPEEDEDDEGEEDEYVNDLELDIIFQKHDSSIFRPPSNPVCSFSMMAQVRLCAVWPTENRLGSSMNHIQGWKTV